MSKECPSCHADCPDVYQCDDCRHMFCKWCGKYAFVRGGPIAAHGCPNPNCEGSFWGSQTKVSRDDDGDNSEDSSQFDTESDSGSYTSSDYDSTSLYSTPEGSSGGGGLVLAAVIGVVLLIAFGGVQRSEPTRPQSEAPPPKQITGWAPPNTYYYSDGTSSAAGRYSNPPSAPVAIRQPAPSYDVRDSKAESASNSISPPSAESVRCILPTTVEIVVSRKECRERVGVIFTDE